MTERGTVKAVPLRSSLLSAPLASLLVSTSVAVGRLDQRLLGHPLLPAFLLRARLQTVSAQAATDGYHIDPWRLIAVLEGFPLRQPAEAIDRADLHDATWCAYDLYAWLTFGGEDRQPSVDAALRALEAQDHAQGPLLCAGEAFYHWIWQDNRRRAPMRAALVRYWQTSGLLRNPIPLTGARAFRTEAPQDRSEWIVDFLSELQREAERFDTLLSRLEYAWRTGHQVMRGQRSTSRAGDVLDLLTLRPMVSATCAAEELGMSVNTALHYFERMVKKGIAVEITSRLSRRFFSLKDCGGLTDTIAPPRRWRVKNQASQVSGDIQTASRVVRSPQRWEKLDYGDLDQALQSAERAVKRFIEKVK
ncbi:hypothetical protein GOB87_15435 [Acetobacter estunensis]|uniref:Uncharacterized protein n=1 Tax=Acetobacter estunensis TaxID=104097 RepID=A0A967B7G9_9PROT|nr:hypothetical protein [Acetobacter estunensis]NHO55310.1 hypothetical protein [Acetobacter estunensis]